LKDGLFRVAEVEVTIRGSRGELIEDGLAELESDKGDWCYRAENLAIWQGFFKHLRLSRLRSKTLHLRFFRVQKRVQQPLNLLHFGDQDAAFGAAEKQSQQLLKSGANGLPEPVALLSVRIGLTFFGTRSLFRSCAAVDDLAE
jgi:hypothetical protein